MSKLTGDARAHAQELLDRLREAHKKGNAKRAAYWQRQFFLSYHARLVATHDAYGDMRPSTRPPKAVIEKVAKNLNPWTGTQEPVEIRLQEKKTNPDEWRAIMNFGLENRALQHLVAECVKARSHLYPCQFASQGAGGRDAAMKQLRSAVQEGFHFVVETDIRNYYPSLSAGKLKKILPLPKEVIEKVLTSKDLKLWSKDPWLNGCCSSPDVDQVSGGCISQARQGIPQGSAASPIVAELVLSAVIDQIPKQGQVVNFADNIVVLVDQPEAAVSMCKALGQALKASPVGPLTPKTINIYGPGDSLDFLGYRVTLAENDCCLEPAAYNLSRFAREFNQRLAKAKTLGMSEARALLKYVNGWTSAFHLWHGAETHRNEHLATVHNLCAEVGKK